MPRYRKMLHNLHKLETYNI